MREGAAWSQSHGLQFRILLLSRGTSNIYFQLTRISRPIIPSNSEVAVCDSYASAVEALQQHGFIITEQQLQQLKSR